MIILLRLLGGLIGALLIYMAGFLHEDQEGRLEGWLGTGFDRVARADEDLVNSHAALVRRGPVTIEAWLKRLLGERLMSARTLLVTTLVAAGAALGAAGGEALEDPLMNVNENLVPVAYIVLVAGGILGSVLVIMRLERSTRWRRGIGITAIATFVAILVLIDVGLAFLVGLTVVAGVLTIACVRLLMRRASAARSDRHRAVLLLTGPILIVALLCVPLGVGYLSGTLDDLLFYYIALVWSGPAFLPAAILFVLQLALLVHRLLVRIVLQPVYAIRPHRLILEHRTAAFAAGAIMILFAFNPDWFTSNPLTRLLDRLRERG